MASDFLRLKEHLIAATGLAYYADKDQDLQARIGRRMSRQGIGDYATYLRLLEDSGEGAAELDALVAELTIGETYFFRQSEQFEALARLVLPDLLEGRRCSRRLRIWSAGCATGAEPYSIAILLGRQFAGRLEGWEISILGTDINREFLARAGEGRFDAWSLRATPEEITRTCFRPEGKWWDLREEYRAGVSFQYHNLARDPFPSLVHNLCGFDLILCRNVMIYFDRAVTRRIVQQFHESLVEGGWLLVGHAEPNIELFREFRAELCGGETLYQKAGPAAAASPEPQWQPCELPELLAAPLPERPPAPAPADLARVRVLADRGEWDRAAVCCRSLIASDALNPPAHFYYALVLDQMGRTADAERALRRAVYLDRGFVLAHYHLGLLLQNQDAGRARRAFENTLAVLSGMRAEQVFTEGDGITARQLAELTRMHLDVLSARLPAGRDG